MSTEDNLSLLEKFWVSIYPKLDNPELQHEKEKAASWERVASYWRRETISQQEDVQDLSSQLEKFLGLPTCFVIYHSWNDTHDAWGDVCMVASTSTDEAMQVLYSETPFKHGKIILLPSLEIFHERTS